MNMDSRKILTEQIEYYRARAPEYDEWHLRQGRYDRGEAHRQVWVAELDAVRSALRNAHPSGRVLELACGTGLWTGRLAENAEELVAVDASPEAIEINRAGNGHPHVRYIVADIFDWRPEESFDFIFFGFWLSHVPPELFDNFWRMVRAVLKPGGRVFFVDSLMTPDSTAKDHAHIDGSGTLERKLNNGSVFRIVKIFYEPRELERRLRSVGWNGTVSATGRFFLYGSIGTNQPGGNLSRAV